MGANLIGRVLTHQPKWCKITEIMIQNYFDFITEQVNISPTCFITQVTNSVTKMADVITEIMNASPKIF